MLFIWSQKVYLSLFVIFQSKEKESFKKGKETENHIKIKKLKKDKEEAVADMNGDYDLEFNGEH